MRILHVCDSYLPKLGGIEVMVQQFTSHQRALGHEVRVLTLTRGEELDGVWRDPRHLGELLGWADTVHVHVSMASPLAFRALTVAAHRGLPTVASVHSLWVGGEAALATLGRVTGWRNLPVVWAPVSEVAARSVRRTLPADADVVVLPNAVDLDYWQPLPEQSEHPLTIVAVGRLAPRKRPVAVVDVLGQVRRHLPDDVPLRAVLAGEGWMRSPVTKLLRMRHMDDWVSTPGILAPQELRELYAGADIALAPSALESFGLAALEARVSGLVVVGRSGTGVADFVEPEFLVSSDDEMARVVAQLCSDLPRLHALKQEHREHTPPFGWTHLMERAEDLYARAAVLQETPRSSR